MGLFEVAMVGGGCAVGGFAAGVAVCARRIPRTLAALSADDLRRLGRHVAVLRHVEAPR